MNDLSHRVQSAHHHHVSSVQPTNQPPSITADWQSEQIGHGTRPAGTACRRLKRSKRCQCFELGTRARVGSANQASAEKEKARDGEGIREMD